MSVFRELFERMYQALGPQHWWPGETPFEVCVGAILTQNTNWQNVERAIENLKKHGALAPRVLYEMPLEELAVLIRPAGYFRVKAKRLKNFVRFLMEKYGGRLEDLFAQGLDRAREELLSVSGIGPETADSILLYAGGLPTFVIDAYTKRILCRHGLATEEMGYEDLRERFMKHLPHDAELFNEYHALFVAVGKEFCRPRHPRCEECPLRDFSPEKC
ncbi:MAG: endonuclease III domain-containing protein [Thermodesulfobacteria bacterium]|nr:endonuclease III domain-containing protein [Thermodesulfobacteriota bacterium]